MVKGTKSGQAKFDKKNKGQRKAARVPAAESAGLEPANVQVERSLFENRAENGLPLDRMHPDRRVALARQLGNSGLQRLLSQTNDREKLDREQHESQSRSHNPSTEAKDTIIQRFISSEHQSLGDVTLEVFPEGTLFPGSPELTYGEVVAMAGDFYASYEQLASPYFILKDGREDRTPGSEKRKIEEINALKNLLRIEGDLIADHRRFASYFPINPHGFYPEGLDTGYVTDPASGIEVPGFELATQGRYGALALENFLHFSFGEENLNAWREGHRQALIEAFVAGVTNKPENLLPALARNAAANHYLTDAFSSGHMRVPRRCADSYYRSLMVGVTDALVETLVNSLPEKINIQVPLSELNDYLPDWAPSIPDLKVNIPLPLQRWARDLAQPLADKLRPSMDKPVGQALGGLVSKWLHDKENERGLCVSNRAGGYWQAFGDAFLDQPGQGAACNTNTTNRAEAQKAVLADYDEVQSMYIRGMSAAQDRAYVGGITPVIFFAFDQPKGEADPSAIDPPGQAALDTMAAYLQTVDGVSISLTGWADSRGRRDYNKRLSQRRINAVKTYLSDVGVPAETFGPETPQGEPEAPTNASNHAMFRRVEVELEGTPVRKQEDNGTELPPDVVRPPEIEGPYQAENYVPHVESNNPLLEPYEWCDITNPGLKAEVSDLAREMVGGLLNGKATEFLYSKLSDLGPYHIEVDLPVIGRRRLDIPRLPIRRLASDAVEPLIQGGVNRVLTDSIFTGLMNGTCSLAEGSISVDNEQCGGGA